MMRSGKPDLSKNILYNLILTVSGYVFPILTFPYVTRVLGPESYGTANFILSVVDYAIMLSSLGIGLLGVKEIARCNGDESRLNGVFSSLFSMHLTIALLISAVYLATVFAVGEFRENYPLYLVGTVKIIANVFLIEWLYSGLQQFRYITLRSIIVRTLYVVAVFLFIRKPDDYGMFVILTVAQVFANSLINWFYSRSIVRFRYSLKGTRQYFGPALSLGTSSFLLSFYVTFIVMYLGFASGDAAVGYYTTSTKLYAILLSLLGAFNGGLMPYVNSLYGKGGRDAMKGAVSKSLSLVLLLSIPTAVYSVFMADDIIEAVAGPQYHNSVLPFKIIIFQVVLVGISQVTELQILLTLNKTKEILFCTGISVLLSVVIMLLFVRRYAEVAAACAVMIPHILEFSLLYFFARKSIVFKFPWRSTLTYIGLSLAMLVFIWAGRRFVEGVFPRLALTSGIAVLVYIGGIFALKDPMAKLLLQKASDFIHPHKTVEG